MPKNMEFKTDEHPQSTTRRVEQSFVEPETSLSWHIEMAARADRIEKLEQQLEERDNQIARLNQTIDDIFNSTSWKISTPLRLLRVSILGDTFAAAFQNAFIYLKSKLPETPKPPSVFDTLQELQQWGNIKGIDQACGTVLVVSHEASRTGAPILSLNIAKELKKKYNVVFLLLGHGVLVDDFKKNSDIVIGPIENRYDEIAVSSAVNKLLDSFNISFAVINSIESRNVLPSLSRRFVPTIALIHEFATYTRPREAFIQAAFWASTVVFPEEIVRENAVYECPELAGHHSVIIPQGRCSLLGITPDGVSTAEERNAISRILRPAGWQHEPIVILGAGYVQLRKGVDLFLDCAARITRSNLGNNCRFVWVGRAFGPEEDAGYSVYLADQIQRSGLGNHIAFVGEVTEMDCVYEKTDILLLSSRLDPLPNVAIDAMFHGIPVVCMDKTTGLAELLKKHGLADECVAPYRDVEALSNKLSRFIESRSFRNSVGEKLKHIAQVIFNMETYVDTLDKLGIQAMGQSLQEKEDCLRIETSGLLRPDFYLTVQREDSRLAIREYVRAWASRIGRKKPLPGFHPGIYLEKCGKQFLGDPFADFLRSGMPSGPWLSEFIAPVTLPEGARIAVGAVALHVHIEAAESARSIFKRLNANTILPDLFISVVSGVALDEVNRLSNGYHGLVSQIQIVPNSKLEIQPLLNVFGRLLADNYAIIGHVHTLPMTQKLVNSHDVSFEPTLFEGLMENLIGGKFSMVDSILTKMAGDPSIGLVFADNPDVSDFSDIQECVHKLVNPLGFDGFHEPCPISPFGNMFWIKTKVFERLIGLDFDWEYGFEQNLLNDRRMQHAIALLLPLIAEKVGFQCAVTKIPFHDCPELFSNCHLSTGWDTVKKKVK